jgi:hypothetical protein
MRNSAAKIFSVLCLTAFIPGLLCAGLSVTPARQEVVLTPGGEYQGVYSVRNEYDWPAKIDVGARDWFTLPENKGIPLADWLSVNPQSFVLQPGESRDVTYMVRLSSAARGVSVAMISFVPTVAEEQGVTMMISASLFVTAAGTERVDWRMENVKIEKNASQMQVTVPVRNNGNVHVRPKGTVEILSRGKKVLELSMPESRPVYPGTSRIFYATSDRGGVLKKGRYKAVITVQAAGQEQQEKISIKINKKGVVSTR